MRGVIAECQTERWTTRASKNDWGTSSNILFSRYHTSKPHSGHISRIRELYQQKSQAVTDEYGEADTRGSGSTRR